MSQLQVASPLPQIAGVTEAPHIVFPWLEDKKVYLNKLYKVTVDNTTDSIEDQGARSYIADLITAEFNFSDSSLFMKTSSRIVNEMEWNLENNRGKLLTRLSSFVHKNHKKEISQNTKNKITEYINSLFPPKKEYFFDIDVSLHWLKGEFGDTRSCFFDGQGEGNYSFEKLRTTEGYYSLRFFKPFPITVFPENNLKYLKANFPFSYYIEDKTIYRGYARNWLRYGEGVSYPIIFNSYGHTSRTAALVFKEFLGSDKLTIRDMNVTNTNLYNNGDAIELCPEVVAKGRPSYVSCYSSKSRKPFLTTELSKESLETKILEVMPEENMFTGIMKKVPVRKWAFVSTPMAEAFAKYNVPTLADGADLSKEPVNDFIDHAVTKAFKNPVGNDWDEDDIWDD